MTLSQCCVPWVTAVAAPDAHTGRGGRMEGDSLLPPLYAPEIRLFLFLT